MFNSNASVKIPLSEQSYYPDNENIFLPEIDKSIFIFLKKTWYSFVNKMVSITFNESDYSFDNAVFEVIIGSSVKIVAVSSQIQMDRMAMGGVPKEFDEFVKKTKGVKISNPNNFTANYLRVAVNSVNKGEIPEINIVNLREDPHIHPKLKKIIPKEMKYLIGVPLFINNSPIGVLWGVRSNPLNSEEKEKLFPQLYSLADGIEKIISLERDRNNNDYKSVKSKIERIDTTSRTLNLFYTKIKEQKTPIRSILAKSIKYNKNYRLDASYIIPSSSKYNISMKRFLPEKLNSSNKTLLMMPGFFCNRTIMDNLAREMSLHYGYKVISMDFRGRSKSTLIKGNIIESWSIDDFINEDFSAAINWISEQYPEDKIVVFGHSMGAMIPRFYASSFDKIKRNTGVLNLPVPEKHIAGIVAIASPDFINVQTSIPGFDLFRKSTELISNNFISKTFVGDIIDKLISVSISTVLPSIDLQKYFSIFNNINGSMRHLAFKISTKILTLKDFLGYPQMTPPEMYLIMEDIICKESTRVMIQFLRSQLSGNHIKSFDGKINYTKNLKDLDLPLFTILGKIDAIAPASTIKPNFQKAKSKNKVLMECDQGHLGIIMHPKTVRDIAGKTDEWIKKL